MFFRAIFGRDLHPAGIWVSMPAMNASRETTKAEKVAPQERHLSLAGQRIAAPRPAPGLHLVATPLGNLEDITLRALKTLAGADAILAEDTRHTARLLERYGIRRPLQSYHEHSAPAVRERIIAQLQDGAALALVSDAGTPLISDPGVKLVRETIAAGVDVHAVPGPSAALAALAVSGLASERFLFAGFPPAKRAARRRFFEELKDMRATLVLFESPHRIAESLADMVAVFGPRPAALCRELTKLHEEILRAPLPGLAADMAARERVRGEITLVIAPPEEVPAAATQEDVEAALKEALQRLPAGRAAAEVARRFGLKKRDVYDRAVSLSGGGWKNAATDAKQAPEDDADAGETQRKADS